MGVGHLLPTLVGILSLLWKGITDLINANCRMALPSNPLLQANATVGNKSITLGEKHSLLQTPYQTLHPTLYYQNPPMLTPLNHPNSGFLKLKFLQPNHNPGILLKFPKPNHNLGTTTGGRGTMSLDGHLILDGKITIGHLLSKASMIAFANSSEDFMKKINS